MNLDSEDFHLEAIYRHRTCWYLHIFGVSSHPNMYCHLEVVFLLAHKCLISCRVTETFICVHMVTRWRAVKCTINRKNIIFSQLWQLKRALLSFWDYRNNFPQKEVYSCGQKFKYTKAIKIFSVFHIFTHFMLADISFGKLVIINSQLLCSHDR